MFATDELNQAIGSVPLASNFLNNDPKYKYTLPRGLFPTIAQPGISQPNITNERAKRLGRVVGKHLFPCWGVWGVNPPIKLILPNRLTIKLDSLLLRNRKVTYM